MSATATKIFKIWFDTNFKAQHSEQKETFTCMEYNLEKQSEDWSLSKYQNTKIGPQNSLSHS